MTYLVVKCLSRWLLTSRMRKSFRSDATDGHHLFCDADQSVWHNLKIPRTTRATKVRAKIEIRVKIKTRAKIKIKTKIKTTTTGWSLPRYRNGSASHK